MNRITVVIPCHNEEVSIGAVISSLPKEVSEVIVVDNNSTDATGNIAQSHGARVVKESVPGYGAAIERGFREATGEIIITIDGDGQHPVSEIPAMVGRLLSEEVDFISGTRFPLKGAYMMRHRRIGNFILTLLTNCIFGLRLTDSQSGMWVFRRNVLNHISLVNKGMSASQEIKIKVASNPKLRFAEHHIVCAERDGTSRLSPLRDGLKNVLALFRLAILRFWDTSKR